MTLGALWGLKPRSDSLLSEFRHVWGVGYRLLEGVWVERVLEPQRVGSRSSLYAANWGQTQFCDPARLGTPVAVARRWLGIYLRDHHAASAGGVALARRSLGPDHPVAREIARDREALKEVMRQLGVAPSAVKVTLVRIAERAGRLKPNGRFLQRSPLSSVVELEVLVVGIRAKEALWSALLTAGVNVQGIDLEALVHSARTQGREVDELRLSAVAETLGGNPARDT